MTITMPLTKILCPDCKARGLNVPLCETDGTSLIIHRHRADVFIQINGNIFTMRCFREGCRYMFVTTLANITGNS